MNRALLVLTLLLSMPALASGPDFSSLGESYQTIHAELIADRAEGLEAHAQAIAAAARSMATLSAAEAGLSEDADELLAEVAARADELAAARGLEAVRAAFYELSKPLIRLRELVQGERLAVAWCPMERRSWLQPEEPIENPYDPSMLGCGEIVSE